MNQTGTLKLLFCLILLSCNSPALALEAEYAVSTGDRLRIIVFERPDLSGEYTVSESGTVGVPRLGRLRVGGRTTEEIERLLAAELTRRMQGGELSVLVDIAVHRPFYVRGDVEKPGAYPYVPGLTVAQALAIAGGQRTRDANAAMLRLEAERAVERAASQALARAEARTRLARLGAEARAGDGEIEFPGDLGDGVEPAVIEALRRRERAILAHRRAAFASELAALARHEELLKVEIAALREQLAAKRRQAALLEEENRELRRLFERQLLPSSRFYENRRLEADVEATIRELEGRVARASREVVQLSQQGTTLRETRAAEITTGLREAEIQIEAAERAIEAARSQADVADRGAAQAIANAAFEVGRITIARRGPQGWVERPVEEFDPVLPDDVIRAPSRLRPSRPGQAADGQRLGLADVPADRVPPSR